VSPQPPSLLRYGYAIPPVGAALLAHARRVTTRGEVKVEPDSGPGAAFCFLLPAAQVEAA